jgi:hypothetical protein
MKGICYIYLSNINMQTINKARMLGHSDSDSGLKLTQNAKRRSELRNLACCMLFLFLFRVKKEKKKGRQTKQKTKPTTSNINIKPAYLMLRPPGQFSDWTTCYSLETMFTISTNKHMLEYITFTDSNWLTNRSWPSVTRCSFDQTISHYLELIKRH